MRSLLIICLLALAVPGLADTETPSPSPVVPADVLRAGPVVLRLPAFHEAQRAGADLDDLVDEAPAVPGSDWPADGDAVPGPDGSPLTWTLARGASFPVVADQTTLTWTAFYVTTDRWQKARWGQPNNHSATFAEEAWK